MTPAVLQKLQAVAAASGIPTGIASAAAPPPPATPPADRRPSSRRADA